MPESQFACGKCGKTFSAVPDANGMVTCIHCQAQFIIESPQEKQTVPSAPAEAPMLDPGTDVNGFEIIRLIGQGGMGCVYLAKQKSMDREVALKITRNPEAVQQFQNEIRNSGKLQHPNIVSAYDAGESNGNYYLAIQFIKGDTLDNIIEKGGPLPEIKALKIILQIATALDYVWSKFNMYHRDIKPGNFMLNEDGTALLMDMGIAQRPDEWKPGEAIEGSPYYMSPEQIQGERLSWTTDLYSLGASLFQMISGKVPFDAESIEDILKKHCSEPVPKIKEIVPDIKVADTTQAMIEKMMEKTPAKRFSSWKALIKQLNTIIASMTSTKPKLTLKTTTSIPPVQTTPEPPKKDFTAIKKIVKIAVIVLVAAGVIGGLTGGFFWYRGKVNSSMAVAMKTLEAARKQFAEDYDSAPALEKALTSAKASANFLISAEFKFNLAKAEKEIPEEIRKAKEENEKFQSAFTAISAKAKQLCDTADNNRKAKKVDIKTTDNLLKQLNQSSSELNKLKPNSKSGKEKKTQLAVSIEKAQAALKADQDALKKAAAAKAAAAKAAAAKAAAAKAAAAKAAAAKAAAAKAAAAKAAAAKKKQTPQKPAPKQQKKAAAKPAPKPAPRPQQLPLIPAANNFRNQVWLKAYEAFTTRNYKKLISFGLPGNISGARPKNPQEKAFLKDTITIYSTLKDYAVGAEHVWNAINRNPASVGSGYPVSFFWKGQPALMTLRGFEKGSILLPGNRKVLFTDLAAESKYLVASKTVKKMNLTGNDLVGFLAAEAVPPQIVGRVLRDSSQRQEYMLAFNGYFKLLKQRSNPVTQKRLKKDFGKFYNTLGK